MSCIHYKFRSSLEYDTITFDGLAISLGDLKKSIMAQKKIAKVTDFDLEVTNAQTKEEYKDESTQIPKNSSVIVRRIPTGTRSKAQLAADRGDTSYASGLPKTKTEDHHSTVITKQSKIIDLVNSDASEEDKLKVMMSQAGEDWQPNQYVRGRGRGYNPSGPLPPNYVCYRCGKPGHFIRNCPTNGVKRTIGIPRKFGEEPAAETTDEKETTVKTTATKKLVPVVQETNTVKDRKVPSELKCPMCQNLLHDAVLIPCCGTSYCDECIRTYLLENEQECPTCGAEDVSPDSLIINKQLRQAVNNFRNARPASPFVNSSTDKSTSDKTATSTVENPSQTNTIDKPLSPYINAGSPSVRSPDTSEKEKSEDKVTSTTSEVPTKDVLEVKKEDLKKEGSPVALKGEVNSPKPDPSSDAEERHIKHQPREHQARPGGHGSGHTGYGQHPMHRGPGMMHPIAEPIIPRSMAPEGALVVPPMRPSRPLIIQQPGFMAATPMGIRPVIAHPGMVHPTLHMEPHLLGAPFPLGVKPRMNPFGDEGPPMSEEEFYRIQKKMKIRNKRKHGERDKDRLLTLERGSRERSRERERHHPANFDDELSQYRALQRHRSGNYRSRSRSRSRSLSRSFSRSPSRSSRSMSKSPTPEDWDRSRTPSPTSQVISDSKNPDADNDKKHKRKKRKKHHKHKHSKKRKSEHNTEEEAMKEQTTGTEKSEKKSKSKKKSKEKSQKKENPDNENNIADTKGEQKENQEKKSKEKSQKKEKPDNENNIADTKREQKENHEKKSKEKSQKKEKPDNENNIPDTKYEQKQNQEKEVKIDTDNKESSITKTDSNEQQTKGPELEKNEDKENEQNGTELESKDIKKTKKKSNDSKDKSKRKSKEKSGDKKHKKKKHKRKHKKHKKEKGKASSQSAEEKSGSTEETQDSDEEIVNEDKQNE